MPLLTIEQCRQQCRVDSEYEDALLGDLLASAEDAAAAYLNRAVFAAQSQLDAALDALPAAIKHAAYPIAGVYSCRPVKDTGRLSMHSYAAAIDLNVTRSDYWLWQKKSGAIPYRNRMPQEIVDIFERHGFIWGGKWYHYDTMHFEYRPELLGMSGKP